MATKTFAAKKNETQNNTVWRLSEFSVLQT